MGDGGAAAAAGTLLPRDAIFNILSWAPFKSVCRFRCVSKEWLALISDPAFIAQHRSRSGPLLVGSYCFPGDGGLLVMDMKGNVLRTVKGLGPFPVARSSLDKLVCVYCPEADGTRLVDVTTGNVLVTFPSTDVGTRGRVNKVYAVSVGRAAVSNSRKVVCITEYLSYNGQPQQACHVLTLGQHDHSDWRQAPSPPALVRMLNFESSGVIANGVVHFLFAHKPALADSVLRFDLDSEEWSKTIQGPLRVDMEFWNKTGLIRLTQLNETLCMIQTEESQTDDHRCTNIWLLIDADNSKWNKTYVIQMPVSFYMVEPLCFMPDGIKLLLCYHSITISPPVLRVYDPSVGTCTDAMKMPKHTCGEVRHCNLHLDCFGVGKI